MSPSMIGELAFAQQLSRGLQVFLPEPRVASENRKMRVYSFQLPVLFPPDLAIDAPTRMPRPRDLCS
jgi:hypothetical protein